MSGLGLQESVAIIGALGVITSFIYAAVQVRRNTRAMRAQMYVQVTLKFADTWEEHANNPDMIDILFRGGEDFNALNRIEKGRFRFSAMAYFRRFETAFFLHKIGILNEQDWAGITGDMDSIFSLPGVRQCWPLIKNRCGPEFQAYVEVQFARKPPDTPQPTSDTTPSAMAKT